MRIVLSRKGYDSANGGRPSPVFREGCGKWENRMFSLPIPESDKIGKDEWKNTNTERQWKDIDFPCGFTPEIRKPCKWNGEEAFVHLDPDIRQVIYDKCPKNWKPAYGQNDGFVTHIFNCLSSNEKTKCEILFLFYGLFRDYIMDGKTLKAYGKEYHAIWGYMLSEPRTIDDKIRKEYPWHPHCKNAFKLAGKSDNNTLFVPQNKTLTINGNSYPSYGAFKFDDSLCLTNDKMSASKWKENALPWFNIGDKKPNMSFHNKASFKDGYFQSAYPGQEFVVTIPNIEKETAITNWLEGLFKFIDYEWNDYDSLNL